MTIQTLQGIKKTVEVWKNLVESRPSEYELWKQIREELDVDGGKE